MVYEMATGRRAFEATSRVGLMAAIAGQDSSVCVFNPAALARSARPSRQHEPVEGSGCSLAIDGGRADSVEAYRRHGRRAAHAAKAVKSQRRRGLVCRRRVPCNWRGARGAGNVAPRGAGSREVHVRGGGTDSERRSSAAVCPLAQRRTPGQCRRIGQGQRSLASHTRQPGHAHRVRYGWRGQPLLVARQPLHWVLCRRQTQDRGSVRSSAATAV